MKALFDTHSFIWWDSEPDRLSPRVRALCRDPANTLLLSVASVWEIQIKHQVGKLQLTLPLPELVEGQRQRNQIELLPIVLEHVLGLQNLPAAHKDPFDRLLIAQAIVEDAVLLSHDPVFAQYPVRVEW